MMVRRAGTEDARSIAKVRVDTWRTTYRGLVPDHVLKELSRDRDEERWRRAIAAGGPAVVHVLEYDDGNVVGFAASGPERTGHEIYRSEIYAIYIRREYQGKGGGHLLLRTAVDEIRRNHHTSMLIWALSANPYTTFYERCGGLPVLHRTVTIGGADLDETGYGWRDLGNIF